MARIAGIDLPKQKRGIIGLTYIHGIGSSRAAHILKTAKVSEDTKVERKLRKQTIINTKKELEEHTQAVKDLNKDIKEGNKIQDTAQEKKLQEQIDEIRELKKSTDQASDEYKELSKKETDLMKKFLKVSDEGADHDATMAKRQDLISKRDKASELIREEKDKDRGFASKKMMGLLSGIEKGIGGMWKKGKAAVGLTFKGALIATGLLLSSMENS